MERLIDANTRVAGSIEGISHKTAVQFDSVQQLNEFIEGLDFAKIRGAGREFFIDGSTLHVSRTHEGVDISEVFNTYGEGIKDFFEYVYMPEKKKVYKFIKDKEMKKIFPSSSSYSYNSSYWVTNGFGMYASMFNNFTKFSLAMNTYKEHCEEMKKLKKISLFGHAYYNACMFVGRGKPIYYPSKEDIMIEFSKLLRKAKAYKLCITGFEYIL